MLAKPAFRALVLTVAAGLPVALAGCGAKDAPNASGVNTTSVNPDDPKSWDDFLKSIEVTPLSETREDPGTERASGKRGVFLIYPVGEVRKVGLRKFRVDVTNDFDAKGVLRFSKGSKTLYESPFDPAQLTKESFVAQLPAAVLETLGSGDDVKWGIYFSDKKVKDVVATFKIIEKSAATKEIAKKIDGNKSLASTPTIRDLARAEILMNYSLYSEAVEVLSDVAASDKTLTAPYLPLANALRRLKLKDSPLFQESQARAVVQTRNGRGVAGIGPNVPSPGVGTPGTDGSFSDPKPMGGKMTQPGSTPIAKSAGDAKPGLRMGGAHFAPLPKGVQAGTIDPAQVPAEAQDAWRALQQLRLTLKSRADQDRLKADKLQEAANALAKQAADLATQAQNAQNEVKTLEQKLKDANEALGNNPGDAAAEALVHQLNDQLAAAQKTAEQLQKDAEQAAKEALQAQGHAEYADKMADQSEQALQAAPPGPVGTPGAPTLPSDASKQSAEVLKQAYENAATAQSAYNDAKAALDAAVLASTKDGMDALEQSLAAEALAQAQKALDVAKQQLDGALAGVQSAEAGYAKANK